MARPKKSDTDIAGKDFPAGSVTKNVTTAAKTRPIRTFRVDNVSAAVWARTIVRAETFTVYSITLESHYEDDKGNQKYSGFFRPNELPKIVSLCQQAEQYILELQRADLAKKTEQAPPAQ